ncbi:hypothetical protein NUH88_17685 [Nisaea acidiphila]|uniref:Guanylate cyclase domain-containing protein n=1 Tax=Nisaea acidiphila TaxID=1862145 RepID=A0A9J7APY3_9PROT|nr:adenylate/guanylate cyclase domain-containing protein [Nisaea acidiphila]UUX49222.1 hypothetical protein NUH88_17685 [Nisaea acidiphila]
MTPPSIAALSALDSIGFVSRSVLVADMADSVRLIAKDEQSVIERWIRLVDTVENQILPRTSGRMVKSLGDGFLVEFEDARSAVAAALGIQSMFQTLETSQPDEQKIRLRIGIEVGEVISGARDVYGHKVNVAARLGGLARPGEIVVSAAVRDRLALDIDCDIEDMGPCYLKNLDDPVRSFRLSPPNLERMLPSAMNLAHLQPTIAVIPFSCPYREPERQIIGEVLADTIIEPLSRSMFTNVISRLSTSAFRNRTASIKEICGQLGANYVLSGSYMLDGDTVHLQTELADGGSGNVIRAEPLNISLIGPAELRAEIVDRFIETIGMSIASQEVRRARVAALPTLETHTLLIAAITLMHRNTVDDFTLARDLLAEIVNRTPRHPVPHAHIAHWLVLRAQQGWSPDLTRDGDVALDHTRRALDTDPDSSLALTVEGLVTTHFLKRFDVAEDRYEMAVRANPNSSLAWLLKGALHAFVDQGDVAVESTSRALALSPLDPQRYYYDSLAATACLADGKNEQSLELADRSLRANKQHTSTLRVKLAAEWRLEKFEQAKQTALLLQNSEPGLTVSGWLDRTPAASYSLGEEFADIMRKVGIPES